MNYCTLHSSCPYRDDTMITVRKQTRISQQHLKNIFQNIPSNDLNYATKGENHTVQYRSVIIDYEAYFCSYMSSSFR